MMIQNIFYLLGSVYLALGIAVSIGFILLMMYAAITIASMKKHVNEELEELKKAAHEVTQHPGAILIESGRLFGQMMLFGMRRMIQRRA